MILTIELFKKKITENYSSFHQYLVFQDSIIEPLVALKCLFTTVFILSNMEPNS